VDQNSTIKVGNLFLEQTEAAAELLHNVLRGMAARARRGSVRHGPRSSRH